MRVKSRQKMCFFWILLITALLPPGCHLVKVTGKVPSGAALQRIEQLPNYKNGEFQNLDSAGIELGKVNPFTVIRDMINRPKSVRPSKPMPTVLTDLRSLKAEVPTVVWFGHSSFLIKSGSGNILVDPDFSGYAGPYSWMVPAFKGSDIYHVSDLPVIDILLISHDHYDHLDYETIQQLKGKVKHVIVPIGIGSHFIYWGYDPKTITELNWGDSSRISDQLCITATPARHESGRSLKLKKTLWASFVININGKRIFYSGDSGYGRHFKMIGHTYGPFDLALMECGQYNVKWISNHMLPAQTVQAAVDMQGKVILPFHCAKFIEAYHPLNEPAKKLLKAEDSLDIAVTIPEIGEPYRIGSPVQRTFWWNFD
jgi:L-ascorbate metabolism protein UlaG (beta-lactamase superfamily)